MEVEVELDLKMTPELEMEGYLREFSRKIQAKRKDLGLNKTDVIELFIKSKDLEKILKSQIEFLRERTGSKNIKFVENFENIDGVEEFKIKNKSVSFSIKRTI